MGPPGGSVNAIPHDARQQVRDRLNNAMVKRHELLSHLDQLTEGSYSDHMKDMFSSARKAGLDDVDWRVVRLNHCKDPKYNAGVNPQIATEVLQRKVLDGRILEEQLGAEANANWQRAYAVAGV